MNRIDPIRPGETPLSPPAVRGARPAGEREGRPRERRREEPRPAPAGPPASEDVDLGSERPDDDGLPHVDVRA